jgi:hypothetical protein
MHFGIIGWAFSPLIQVNALRCGSSKFVALRRKLIMSFETGHASLTADSNRGESSELPRQFYDSSLLFRCMDMLQVDQRDLATEDPLLFRELQGRCSLCRHKRECVQDLPPPFDHDRRERWQGYCPNSAMLTMIGAVQNCGYAAQHLKMTQSSSEIG